MDVAALAGSAAETFTANARLPLLTVCIIFIMLEALLGRAAAIGFIDGHLALARCRRRGLVVNVGGGRSLGRRLLRVTFGTHIGLRSVSQELQRWIPWTVPRAANCYNL